MKVDRELIRVILWFIVLAVAFSLATLPMMIVISVICFIELVSYGLYLWNNHLKRIQMNLETELAAERIAQETKPMDWIKCGIHTARKEMYMNIL